MVGRRTVTAKGSTVCPSVLQSSATVTSAPSRAAAGAAVCIAACREVSRLLLCKHTKTAWCSSPASCLWGQSSKNTSIHQTWRSTTRHTLIYLCNSFDQPTRCLVLSPLKAQVACTAAEKTLAEAGSTVTCRVAASADLTKATVSVTALSRSVLSATDRR